MTNAPINIVPHYPLPGNVREEMGIHNSPIGHASRTNPNFLLTQKDQVKDAGFDRWCFKL